MLSSQQNKKVYFINKDYTRQGDKTKREVKLINQWIMEENRINRITKYTKKLRGKISANKESNGDHNHLLSIIKHKLITSSLQP